MFEVTAQARWCGKERVPVPIPSSQPTLRAARLRCARGVWDGQTDSNFKVGNQRHGKSNVELQSECDAQGETKGALTSASPQSLPAVTTAALKCSRWRGQGPANRTCQWSRSINLLTYSVLCIQCCCRLRTRPPPVAHCRSACRGEQCLSFTAHLHNAPRYPERAAPLTCHGRPS